MKTDRMTKTLLVVIALGLLLNGFNPWLRPTPVVASVQEGFDRMLLKDDIASIRMNLARMVALNAGNGSTGSTLLKMQSELRLLSFALEL